MNASLSRPRSASIAGAALIALLLCATPVPAQPEDAGAPRPATPLMMRSLYLDGDAVGDHMVIVGERGHILVSRDGGRRWTRARSPTRSTLTGIALHPSGRGWAVGHDAVIVRTEDGGDTWKTVHAAPGEERPLLDVWFENREHGIAVGAYGYVLETDDGGDTWHARDIVGTDRHLNHITASPSGRIYVTAESGRIFRSDDGAKTWKQLPSPYSGSLFGTLPVDADRAYVYGLRGHLFHTSDAGLTWHALDTGTESLLTDGLVLDGGVPAFTGMGGILVSAPGDDGVLALYRRDDRAGLAGALAAEDGALVTFGEFGVERVPRGHLEAAP